MKLREGYIFNIQRAALDDGPGVRTVLFFKGCPLRCFWCHNPESQNMLAEPMAGVEKCVKCGKCKIVCPKKAIENARIDRKLCISCGLCVNVCANDVLKIVGRRYTVDEAVNEALLDKGFFEATGGGVTLSGGEPLMQPEFALDILKELKSEGVNTCVETSGICADGVINTLAPYVNHWLYDIKLTDEELHQSLLGVSFSSVLEGLHTIKDTNSHITLRCPVIPGINNNDEHFAAVRKLARDVGAAAVDILPYHRLGRDKYIQLEREVPVDIPEPGTDAVTVWEKSVELSGGLQ